MTSLTIGIFAGLLIILLFGILKGFDKPILYGLILSGIGFLYVGFTWSDTPSLVITFMQAVFFLLLAYCGITKKVTFLIAGYFLHGLWDLAYGHFNLPDLVPPHYDLFCLAIDFTIGLYLVILNYGLNRDRYLKKQEVQTH